MTAFDQAWSIAKMPYHGTSKARAKLIMEQGLRGQKHPAFPGKRVSFGAKTLDLAREYAEMKDKDGVGAVIHIADDVPTLMNKPKASAIVYEGTIPPEKLSIVKDFRFLNSGDMPNIPYAQYLVGGGYDPKTDEAFVNLRSHVSDFKMEDPESTFYYTKPRIFRDDQDLIDRIVRDLSHEMAHQAMSPPHSQDLWDAVRQKLPNDSTVEERKMAQDKVDSDWERFQEYGAWSATPGIDEDEKWRKLALYGIYPKNAA